MRQPVGGKKAGGAGMRHGVENGDVDLARRHRWEAPAASHKALGHVLAVEGSEARIGLDYPAPQRPRPPDRRQVRRDQGPRHHARRDDLRGLPAPGGRPTVHARWPASTCWARSSARPGRLPLPARGQGIRRDRRPGGDDRPRGAEPDLCLDRRPRRSPSATSARTPRSRPTSTPTTCWPSISPSSARPASASPAPSPRSSARSIEVRPELRVLLLDVHNEYRAAFGSRANVIGAENLRLPFWLFNFEETLNVLYGGKPAADGGD